ncbi:MAG: stage II sporulation protein D [Ruminococcaceae bacterium]|nr:stage II sporulation protein D [Oscillospiraceae bacterium]
MKKIICLSVFLPALLLLTPLPLLKKDAKAVSAGVFYSELLKEEAPNAQNALTETFMVKNHETGEIFEISAEDYICGVICGEMPLSFGDEAIKAQAVAAYTFACVRKASNSTKNYDITTDYTVDQCYLSEAQAREKWGNSATDNLQKIRNLVKEVSGYMVTYKDTAALTVYHSASAGKTQNVSDVWGGDLPYLRSVESPGDVLSESFISTVQFTADEMAQKLKNLCSVSGEPTEWFKNAQKTQAGYISQITVCQKTLTGSEIRAALGLKSTAFEINFFDNLFTITVKGNGHGVGLSQYGAAAMAANGSSFKEILCHYYTGCEVKKIGSN